MPPRRPDPRPARTRATILRAAHELVSERGIEAVTVAQVSARAGVAVGSIYAHFASKEGLVLELVWNRACPVFAELQEAPRDGAPVDRILATGDAILGFAVRDPVAFSVLLSARDLPSDLAEHGAGRLLLEEVRGVVDRLRVDVAQAADAADEEIDEIVASVLALWSGVGGAVARSDRFALPESLARQALRRAGELVA